MPYSDVYMLAKAKNRLNDIFKIYTILKDNNLKPNLLLAGVDIQDQKYKDEITYLNKSIPYEENLQYIFHTHCILEVMQKKWHRLYTKSLRSGLPWKKTFDQQPAYQK